MAMLTEFWIFIGLVAFSVFSSATVLGACWWVLRRQVGKPPLRFKLLRSPGESLRRSIHAFDEDFILHVLLAFMCPLWTVGIGMILVRFLPAAWQSPVIILIFLAAFVVLAGMSVWLALLLKKRRNHLLGYLGERAVAEQLETLLSQGYRVFHDVPAQNRDTVFNIDHVVVGPAGVAVIETKTRRKGPARPGYKDQEVSFDGKRLIWPWGDDQHGLEKVDAEAVWIGQWIEQRVGIRLSPKPILALPGWIVNTQDTGRVAVVSAKTVANAVVARTQQTLTSEQIASIAGLLDERCRDVED